MPVTVVDVLVCTPGPDNLGYKHPEERTLTWMYDLGLPFPVDSTVEDSTKVVRMADAPAS